MVVLCIILLTENADESCFVFPAASVFGLSRSVAQAGTRSHPPLLSCLLNDLPSATVKELGSRSSF